MLVCLEFSHARPLNTETFFGKRFYYFFNSHKRYFFEYFQIFHKKLLIWTKYVFLTCNTFKIECNKGRFLDVNLKTRFFERKNRKNPTILIRMSLKKIPE